MADSSNSALSLLSVYLSDDSSEEEIPGSKVSTKRRASKDWTPKSQDEKRPRECNTKLPLPSAVMSLFPESEIPVDNPADHDYRIRTFPHERGNWSTYVYIHYEPEPAVSSFTDVVLECCKNTVPLKSVDKQHISLTRTVILKHHWIDSFIDSVQKSVRNLPSFTLCFNDLKIYCNEEKTRTFVGLTVAVGHKALIAAVNVLDKCLADFKLPPFYKEPSFHLSIAWCVGDYVHQIEKEVLPQLQVALQQFMHVHHDQWVVNVAQLHCKCGNKLFSFPLAT
ncbi:U6 snRNA phosphodiesterase 1 isoform X1 [Periplaneta americana]|uniref:U6 snRNA phosphodiesterase 1 isoform X1 n=1 Tax=Periplaneta americana TaxID=6978 RepID=UPI0037E94E9A